MPICAKLLSVKIHVNLNHLLYKNTIGDNLSIAFVVA